jgi:putative membrane protein
MNSRFVILTWAIASLHLLAFGIGLGAVSVRGRILRGPLDGAALSRLFLADNLWGLSGILFLGTGLWRLLGGLEKGTDYYLHQPLFHAKMALFLLILVLEIRPAVLLLRWRGAHRRGLPADTAAARGLARLSHIQAGVLLVMLVLATAIARGLAPG